MGSVHVVQEASTPMGAAQPQQNRAVSGISDEQMRHRIMGLVYPLLPKATELVLHLPLAVISCPNLFWCMEVCEMHRRIFRNPRVSLSMLRKRLDKVASRQKSPSAGTPNTLAVPPDSVLARWNGHRARY